MGCGLPIGNLTSQFWANVYLDELDQFAKRELRCRWYLRYVDDMIVLAHDPAELSVWKQTIEEHLAARLALRLRPDLPPAFRVGRGVDFVGWRTRWNHRTPRTRTVAALDRSLKDFHRRLVTLRRDEAEMIRCTDPPPRRWPSRPRWTLARLHSVLASYSGHLRYGDSWQDWSRVLAQHGWLGAMFRLRGFRLRRRWQLAPMGRGFAAQYRALLRGAGPDMVLFCPVGRFIELRGPQRLIGERWLGLRRTYLPRGGFAFAVGFPLFLTARFEQRALRIGLRVVLVARSPAFGMRWFPLAVVSR
ncbi:MAG TPA: RNA-directed DNA polymerase [Terriglobales bacterium]|nr:RNA-directed DNA polymerase [Terriglobales bacterium]